MTGEYHGPTGAFAEMVAVEEQVRETSTPESRKKLAIEGIEQDSKQPEYGEKKPEMRSLELELSLEHLKAVLPAVKALEKALDEFPMAKNFVDLQTGFKYSMNSGNRITGHHLDAATQAVTE